MSVTTYEIGCNYRHPKLKNKVYFLSKSFFNPSTNEVTVHIDNGGASVSIVTHVPHPTPPNVIEGFGIKFTETESLDERYKFTKQLNISINGHLTNTEWTLEHDYYIMVETIEGTFYLINVDFPSKMSFTYNLSNSQDQTDFVFTSNSNFPTLKVNSVPWESFNTCKAYHVPGIDYLKLLEKDYATIDKENGVVNLFNSQTFKDIDYLKNTISLQETYDGDIATTTISFEIPFDDYKTSWQYNLLEFKQNLYVAEVGNVNGNTIFAGFEHGLEPSYEINGSTSESESTSIKITLTEASNWGIFEYDSWSYYNVPEKKWVGVQSEYICLAFGIAGYTLMQEVDENGTPTGRYKCLAGEESRYSDYNIIDTYSEPESFPSPQCSRSMARRYGQIYYTCIDGDKYEVLTNEESFDGEKTWNITYITLGQMVESGSSWCDLPTENKWVLDKTQYTCVTGETYERWVESGTTCICVDLYQNNIKEVSVDNINWYVAEPPEYSASTLIEANSRTCGWKPYLTFYNTENDTTISFSSEFDGAIVEVSVDNGCTWERNSSVKISAGETAMWRCNGYLTKGSENFYDNTGSFTTDKECSISGNVMSMLYQDNFENQNEAFNLKWLFSNTKVTNIVGLLMPATVLDATCYYEMFKGCKTLTGISNNLLPATTVPNSAYYEMFGGCTGLTTTPNLPATTLGPYCYYAMFSGCTSLVNVSDLPAINVPSHAYRNMFDGCTSLINPPVLSALSVSVNSMSEMFLNCTSLIRTPDLSEIISFYYKTPRIDENDGHLIVENLIGGLGAMFEGCTSLTATTILPIYTVPMSHYGSIFYGCTSLTGLTCLARNTDVCYWGVGNFLGNTTDGGTFVKYSASTISSSCSWRDLNNTFTQCYDTPYSGIPDSWSVVNYNNSDITGYTELEYITHFYGVLSIDYYDNLRKNNKYHSWTIPDDGEYGEVYNIIFKPYHQNSVDIQHEYVFGNYNVGIEIYTPGWGESSKYIIWYYDKQCEIYLEPYKKYEFNISQNEVRITEVEASSSTTITYSGRTYEPVETEMGIFCNPYIAQTPIGGIIMHGEIYSFSIMDVNSRLKHNYKPCVDIYGEAGLMDCVNVKFYTPSFIDNVIDISVTGGKAVGKMPYGHKWVESGTTCIGYDKYQNNIKVQTTDGGETWTPVIPLEYSASTLIETQSTDCGFDPTTWFSYKLTLQDSSVISAECSATSAITSGQVSAYSSSCVSAEIGQCVTSLGKRCFYNFSNLTSITISDSVTEIGKEAFNGCNSLPVENNIRYADTYAVGVTDKTLTSYVIKSGTRFIGNTAFAACTGMTSMVIPNSVISIGEGAFARCSGMTSIVLQEGLEKIVSYAFQNCRALTSITIPDSVTSLGSESEQVFGSCYGIQSVTIGNGLTSVYGFGDCTGVTSVTIGSSVTAISNSCFANRNLTTVICLAETPPSIDSGRWSPFYNTPITAKTGVVYVPAQSVDRYKGSGGWMEFKEIIQPIPT